MPGTLSLSSTGLGVTTSIAGVAALSTSFSVKWCQKVDTLRTLGAALAASSQAVGFIDSDGNNTAHKMNFGWFVRSNGNVSLIFHNFGGVNYEGPNASYTNLPAAGSYIICEIDSTTTPAQHFNVYLADGVTKITAISGSLATAFAGFGSLTSGVFTLNRDNSSTIFLQQPTVYGGMAIYNTVLTGGQITSCPLPTDSGLVAGWYMNEATSGSSPTATSNIAGAGLSLTNNSYTADTSPWYIAGQPPKSVRVASRAAQIRSFNW